jgi:1-acyl-sn-glycerol-3-phosphate acyltransferase
MKKELHPDPTRPYMLYLLGRALCRLVTTVMFDLKVYGADHVPKAGGVLLLANHQSFIDPACIGSKMKRPLSFLAKSELFEVPVFGRIIPRLNAFPVHQGAGDIHAVRETIARLKEGHVLTIFPEGSRTTTGEMQPLQPGFALIVRRAGVPIVPVAIDGAFKAWPRGSMMIKPHPVRVMFGPAMKVDHLKPAEIVTTVESTLRALFEKLRAQERANTDNA